MKYSHILHGTYSYKNACIVLSEIQIEPSMLHFHLPDLAILFRVVPVPSADAAARPACGLSGRQEDGHWRPARLYLQQPWVQAEALAAMFPATFPNCPGSSHK